MTANIANQQESQAQGQTQTTENKPSDKELNFRALESKFQRALAEQKAETERLMRELEAKNAVKTHEDDDDQDDEPIDKKRLSKQLNKFSQNTQSEIQKAMEVAKDRAKDEVKRELWLENNPDFYDVLQHAEKFAQKAPKLAETILRMPEGFERQKLVYENIKELGIHKPEQKQSSIQDRIDANRRSPYYQPSGIGTSPYTTGGDFSASGQKNAYAKMQELKNKLRI